MIKVIQRLPLFHLRDVLFYVETSERVVALTLDDGPDRELTPRIMKTLNAYEAKATFFLLGEAAQRNQAAVAEIAAQGHEIGNHTWEDKSTAGLSQVPGRGVTRRQDRRLLRPW
jgi:peptidoglycan/xylan/chitin deacetylase (PgdA/CDA1 family)